MQLNLFLLYAGVDDHEGHTQTMRDFLQADNRVDKVSVMRNACKSEATAGKFRNLKFNCFDDAFARDMLENSHKCTPKDTFDTGTTFNLMRCCDVNTKIAA